jgi:hypothetical protein
MTAHSSGSGSSWNETLDVDQPHGLDYQEWNDIRIGIRKRMAQEHASFADSTVGGIHAPGETAIMGMEDGTPANTTSRGRGIVWDTSSRLWCNTSTAGVSTAYSPCVLSIHPDKQWGGGDVTWVGAHEFDSSVDITGNTTIHGALLVEGSSDFSDVYVDGDISIKGSAKVATDLSLTGDLAVDGTSNFTGDVALAADISVDGTAVFGAKIVAEGDASGNPFPSAWGHADWSTGTLHAGLNVGSVDWTKVGVACVSFTNNLPSGNYAVVLTLSEFTGGAGVDDIIKCVSQGTTGFRAQQTTGAGTLIDDCSEFNFIVFG